MLSGWHDDSWGTRMRFRRENAMTLIETMLVLAVLAILIAMMVPAYTSYIDNMNNKLAMRDIAEISMKVERFVTLNVVPPETLADINEARPDPWGNPYEFVNIVTATGNGGLRKDRNLVPINSDYDLYSRGKDGQTTGPINAPKSRDDIIRANSGGFIGLAEDY